MAQKNFFKTAKQFYAAGGFDSPNPLNKVGKTWYVNTVLGRQDGLGEGAGGFQTMAQALAKVASGDTIIVTGVVREQLVSPAGIHDVSIIGGANRPRQATDNGVATGGGATWMPPASGAAATTPLLRIIGQGWRFENIQFVPHTSSACLTIERNAGPPERDGSHAIIRNCRFVGGTTANGILLLNGGYNCLIEDNEFETLTGTAILSSGTGVSVPANNKILRNIFTGCGNAIAISSNDGRIIGNIIRQATNDSANKINLVSVSAQGENNIVVDNIFSDATANVAIAKGYKPGTGDVWRNYVTDSAAAIVTVPA